MAIYKHVLGGPGVAGDQWVSGLHSSGTGTQSAAHAAFAAFVTSAFGASATAQYWPEGTSIGELITYTLNTVDGKATSVVRSSVSINGAGSALAPAPRDTLTIGLRTATPGPRGRGRMFLPGVALDNLTPEGLHEDAVKTAIAGYVGSALATMRGAGFSPVIWQIPSSTGLPVTGVTISAVPGTQRRRSNKISPDYAVASVA